METLAIGLVGWASGIVTVLVAASFLRVPPAPRGKAPIGFKLRG